ncbi:hypothetical protein P170DRAFT_429333 [Aspergillus steynii IBT 23096]|uniref:Dickkopf N-terminal cysteine-rich domain-containing protein n=1 Tax=Aspergillus steynii IBT 23096 TaxID=1392250 RepID=A0A2I2FZY7_9EURO|nr:uncharacterized protein P170DRAFT_429333 [Aspergillus steynii IBT 23096]PLB46195.1 hypothetical protein P170DRAFT_429333 [Aspergillus steynii IBT 23096]
MKLFTFLLVFLVSVLSTSATVLDTDNSFGTSSEAGRPRRARCTTWEHCRNMKSCIDGYCRYPEEKPPMLLAARDETASHPPVDLYEIQGDRCDSNKNCPGSHNCIRGYCRQKPHDSPATFESPDSNDDDESDAVEVKATQCRSYKDCRYAKQCVKGTCQYPRGQPHPALVADDESDNQSLESRGMECNSAEQCQGGKWCVHGTCRYIRGRPPLTWIHSRDFADQAVNGTCEKDADCGDGICLENVCIDAAVNDDLALDGDLETGISKVRKACSDNGDCPKGKICMWRTCRAPVKIHSTRDVESVDVENDTDLNDADGVLRSDNDSTLLSERDTADPDPEANDEIEEPKTQVLGKTCNNCPKGKVCNRNGKCVDKKCGNRPACNFGWCKNGKCTNGLGGRSYDNGYEVEEGENVNDGADDLDAPETHLLAEGKKCKTFKDCGPYQKCEKKRCKIRPCIEVPTCRPGSFCKNGRCTRSLGLRTGDLRPRSDIGQSDTDTDTESSDGDNDKPSTTCGSNQDCPQWYRCNKGVCKFHHPHLHPAEKRDNEDIAIEPKDEETTISEPDVNILSGKYPPHCQSNNDCPPSQRCYGGICKYRPPHNHPAVKRDEDPTDSDEDDFHITEPEVEVLSNKYPPHCKSNNDCPPSQRCYGGICKYRPPHNHPSVKRDEDPTDPGDDDFHITEPDVEVLSAKPPPYCKSNNDCPRYQRCYGGICKYRGPPSKRDDEDSSDPDDDDDFHITDSDAELLVAARRAPRCRYDHECLRDQKCIQYHCMYHDMLAEGPLI